MNLLSELPCPYLYKSAYVSRWDEAKIKDLMSSEALREVNWKDKTPSDRYKILMEEERRRQEELDIAADTETPGILAIIDVGKLAIVEKLQVS